MGLFQKPLFGGAEEEDDGDFMCPAKRPRYDNSDSIDRAVSLGFCRLELDEALYRSTIDFVSTSRQVDEFAAAIVASNKKAVPVCASQSTLLGSLDPGGISRSLRQLRPLRIRSFPMRWIRPFLVSGFFGLPKQCLHHGRMLYTNLSSVFLALSLVVTINFICFVMHVRSSPQAELSGLLTLKSSQEGPVLLVLVLPT